MPYDLPGETGFLRDGVLRDVAGRPIRAKYVLAPCHIELKGIVVARDRGAQARVYRIPRETIRVLPRPGAPICN